MSPYEAACEAIDRANSEDPRKVAAEGRELPRELVYSRRMVEWVKRLAEAPSEELLLAARAQHVRRWTQPRESFPEGRAGYLAWREKLKKFHAETLSVILRSAGYPDAPVAKAVTLILRKQLAGDPEGQVLEDAACLVFLQEEFAGFARQVEADKMVDILRKTWGKMSPRARETARGLTYGPVEHALLQKALG
jgi:hypothetical protein